MGGADTAVDTAPTLVVVTYNSERLIPGFAASLTDGLAGLSQHRLVVVDNASSDGTLEQVRRLLPDAEVVETGRNAGYSAAINAGASCAPHGPLVVLNPDVRLLEGSVARLLEALDEPGVGVSAPLLLELDGTVAPSLRREPSASRAWSEALLGGRRASRMARGEVVTDQAAYAVDHDVEWASGAVLAISEECRRVVGEWDESFFLYSEEVDWCRRAREAGFRVRFVCEARAEHAGGEYETNPHLWRILTGNRVRYFDRHHGRAARAAFQAGVLVGELLRSPLPGSGAAHRAGARAALRPDPFPGPGDQPTPPGFVWFAAQDWWYHNQAHSDFQLMREVARGRPVLVVNSLGLRMPTPGNSSHALRRVGRKMKSTAKLVRRPVRRVPGFHVMTPVMIPLYGDRVGARVNAWLVRQQVRAVARVVGVGSAPHVGVTIPTAWPVVEPMRRSSLLFNRADLHSAYPGTDTEWITSLEDALLRHSDRVHYVSHELMSRDADVVGERSVFLDHGVDFAHFSPDGEIDPEVAAIPAPRMGFFGGIDDYTIDVDLLRRTAEENPDTSLVLIGDATCSMDALTSLPNVHWLGFRPYARIPALARGFDVALMPWLDNEWVRNQNPIKLKEYLAMGLPVVTTDYPELDAYRDRVLVAHDRADFSSLVQQALRSPADPIALRESVRSCTWSARARELAELADGVGLAAPASAACAEPAGLGQG
jgi:GT2 family glycosyltransferase/glycosyltransferase involved in cell wall biosynthesis